MKDKQNDSKIVKLKRTSSPCCGMEIGKVYDGIWNTKPYYASVMLEDGTWTSDHYAIGFFEEIKNDQQT